jgi:hypothetical protein
MDHQQAETDPTEWPISECRPEPSGTPVFHTTFSKTRSGSPLCWVDANQTNRGGRFLFPVATPDPIEGNHK